MKYNNKFEIFVMQYYLWKVLTAKKCVRDGGATSSEFTSRRLSWRRVLLWTFFWGDSLGTEFLGNCCLLWENVLSKLYSDFDFNVNNAIYVSTAKVRLIFPNANYSFELIWEKNWCRITFCHFLNSYWFLNETTSLSFFHKRTSVTP